MGDPFPQNCPFSWGIWTPFNLWFLGPVRVHNPNGIIISVQLFFAQVTAMGAHLPQSCTLPWGHLEPHLIHGPTRVLNPNGISMCSAVFAHMTAECPYSLLYHGTPLSPSKLPLPMGLLNPHLIHGPLGPPKSSTQMASRTVQPFLEGSLVWQTDRETDSPRYSVFYVLRCGLRST